MSKFKSIIEEIKSKKANLSVKDFLLTWEQTTDELEKTLLVAEGLKWLRDNNISCKCFDSGLAVSLFRDN